MDPLTLTQPIAVQSQADIIEEAVSHAFRHVLADMLGDGMADVADYGCPHIGSPTVIDRFSKLDGLAILRRGTAGDTLMRVIYGEWLALGSERGLSMLEFVLQMLWPDQWTIERMHQPISRVDFYPWDASPDVTHAEYGATFLTPRIRIIIDGDYVSDADALRELSELVPVMRRLVPANVTPSVFVDPPLNEETFDDIDAGYVAVVMSGWLVADYSEFA